MSSFSAQSNSTSGATIVVDPVTGKNYLIASSILASNEVTVDEANTFSAQNQDTTLLNDKAVSLVSYYYGCYDDTRWKFDYKSPFPWSEAKVADFDPDGYIGIKDWNAASKMK